MKRASIYWILCGFLAVCAGCKKQVSDADAIRDGINQHLSGLKTINLSAMDMVINNYSVQGDQAQAQVEFKPKAGAPAGAGMQVNYALQKQQNGTWVVQKTEAVGGAIQHPAPGENPQQPMMPGAASGSTGAMPNLRDLAGGGAAGGALPPGHPQINQQGNSQAPGQSYNSPR